MLGLLAIGYPQLMGGGYGWVQWGAIGENLRRAGSAPRVGDPQMALGLLLTLALLKPLATGFTVGSGGSGGLFGPSLFIGGMLGGAAGQLIAGLFPTWDIQPAAYTLVGMGGFFAGVSKTPLTSIVMVSEIAGSYALLVPMMLVCALAMALSQRWTLYHEQVDSPMDSPVHQGDFLIDVLEGLKVGDVPIRTSGLELIPSNLPFPSLIRRVADSHETVFPVIDGDGRFAGTIAIRDLRPAFLEESFGPLVLAADIAHGPSFYVTPVDDIHQAQKLMTELDIDELPVVDPKDTGLFIGLLDRRELILAQTTRVEELRKIRSARAGAVKHGRRGTPRH
jgi:CIC family chloride channel protein